MEFSVTEYMFPTKAHEIVRFIFFRLIDFSV
jgi:hypothetical protein